jgi:hypothetical protein
MSGLWEYLCLVCYQKTKWYIWYVGQFWYCNSPPLVTPYNALCCIKNHCKLWCILGLSDCTFSSFASGSNICGYYSCYLYIYEFWLSLCKIVRSSVMLLLPLIAMNIAEIPLNLQSKITNLQQTALQEHQLFTSNYYKMTKWVDSVYVLHKNKW